jgi:hypothetical protein
MFQTLGMNSTESSLFATGIYGVVKVVACLAFLIFAADSLGRRMSLLWTSIALSMCMFIIGVYMYISPPVVGQPVSQLPGLFVCDLVNVTVIRYPLSAT